MDFRAPAIGGRDPLETRPRAERFRPSAGQRSAPPAATVSLSGGLPPELAEEVSRAAEVVRELREQDRELRFQLEPGSRVRVEVRDLEGRVIREIPLQAALDVAAGMPLE